MRWLLTHTPAVDRFTAVLTCDQCAGPLRGADIDAVYNATKSELPQLRSSTLGESANIVGAQ